MHFVINGTSEPHVLAPPAKCLFFNKLYSLFCLSAVSRLCISFIAFFLLEIIHNESFIQEEHKQSEMYFP